MMRTRFGDRFGACFAWFLLFFGCFLETRFGGKVLDKMDGQTVRFEMDDHMVSKPNSNYSEDLT